MDFDRNATAPALSSAIAPWRQLQERLSHAASRMNAVQAEATRMQNGAGHQVALALTATDYHVQWVGSGTHAIVTALTSALACHANAQTSFAPKPHVICSALEHAAVAKNLAALKDADLIELSVIKARRDGFVRVHDILGAVNDHTRLICLTLACNETGAVQPVGDVVKGLKHQADRPRVLTDAVQAVGRLPINLAHLDVDYLTFAGHKIGAMSGTAAVVSRAPQHDNPHISAAWADALGLGALLPTDAISQAAGAVSLGAALQACHSAPAMAATQAVRDHLEARLVFLLGHEHVEVLAGRGPRLCNTSCLALRGCPGEALAMALDVRGFCVATGSACATGATEVSPKLVAMGLSDVEAREVIRISLPMVADAATALKDVEHLSDAIVAIYEQLTRSDGSVG